MKRWVVPIFFFLLFLFSCYLMLSTFSYDSKNHNIVMASRLWSDFGAHIPLIRSFSLGNNWPPEYPLFPGEKIRYHFLFYAVVGLLERIGFRIDWALNIPSIIGFFALTVLIYHFAVLLFHKKSVGILSVIFFLFNGTLSFLKFFQTHQFKDILTITNFPSFGPWDGSIVTAFGHLNVYTNQRHFAISFAIVLFVLFTALSMQKKYRIRIGVLFGLLLSALLFMNQPALLIAVIFLGYIFLTRGPSRIPLLVAALVSVPFILLFFQIAATSGQPEWQPGYLSQKPFAWPTFLQFWLHNLGLHMFFIPLGMLLAPKRIRFFFIPLLLLFILPNMYRFSIDMINNHKFFNFVTMIGGMYTAYALVRLFSLRIIFIKFIIIISFIILVFSGLIDFMVIKNDYQLVLTDIPANADATFIANRIPPQSIVLNSTWFYHPASVAGRPIYNGYSFFTWSAGYPTYQREAITKDIYRSNDLGHTCEVLHREDIEYIELNRNPENFLQPISPHWKTRPALYQNPTTGVTIYETEMICDVVL